MHSLSALDLNSLVFAVSKLVENNTRKTYFQVKTGNLRLRTLGYTTLDQYQYKLTKPYYQLVNEYFLWNEKFMCWQLKGEQIKGQKLVDITYALASISNAKLNGVEMLKGMGEILIGASGVWEQKDYKRLMGQNLFDRMKTIFTWDNVDNAWLIPVSGKPEDAVNIMKYKIPPKIRL